MGWGSLISVGGVWGMWVISERHLCQNLPDSSICLPGVAFQRALGSFGISERAHLQMWLLPGADEYSLCCPPASGCVSRLPIWLPLGGVRTQGKRKSHSIQFPHPQPGTIFT